MSEVQSEKTFLGHPRGLAVLFLTEIWERFSYYGMRALLVLYVYKHLYVDMGETEAKNIGFGILGSYGALVYASPLLGGMLADKFIGPRHAVTVGSVLMALGHFLMAIETTWTFYLALGLIAIGNGFFKPNVGSLVSALYKEGDKRRDGGFTIFYMGVNIGAFLAPLACGALAEKWGWHYGFNLAGLGMITGLIVYNFGLSRGLVPKPQIPQVSKLAKLTGGWGIGILLAPVFGWVIFSNEFLFTDTNILTWILSSTLVIIMGILIYQSIHIGKVAALRMLVIFILTLFIMVFWAFFEQSGSSLTVYAEECVRLVGLNASQTNSINPAYIMLLAFPFSWLWGYLYKTGRNPSTPVKFGWGILQLGLGFLVFAISTHFADDQGKVSMLFLYGGYLLMTTGELFISPIGLSKVTELSPKALIGFMLGVYYFSSAFGHLLAGGIAKMTTQKGGTGNWLTQLAESLTGYSTAVEPTGALLKLFQSANVFASIGIVSVLTAVVVFTASPILKKWMNGVH